VIGLPYGPRGVALGYSTTMLLWVLPVIAWSVRGTPISFRDVLVATSRPLMSSFVAAVVALTVRAVYGQFLAPIPRMVLETTVLLLTFLGILLFATGQKAFYLDLLRLLTKPSAKQEKTLVST
jgi:hypothetical protein